MSKQPSSVFFPTYSPLHQKLFDHKYVKELKDRPTPEEILFQDALLSVGIIRHHLSAADKEHLFQYPIPVDRKHFYILDFFIESLSLAFEINGGYHDEIRQITKDIRRRRTIEEQWKIRIIELDNSVVVSQSQSRLFHRWLRQVFLQSLILQQCRNQVWAYGSTDNAVKWAMKGHLSQMIGEVRENKWGNMSGTRMEQWLKEAT